MKKVEDQQEHNANARDQRDQRDQHVYVLVYTRCWDVGYYGVPPTYLYHYRGTNPRPV